ncbi:hypothetical protein [Nocardia brasiliensis]|uniref:hypothetical protein n=1 Tax=Nocardia brasiliensis TaxID=37326 RepID=UPI0024568DBC|nr:hypothetical protein [Nocardia brasiliensis]
MKTITPALIGYTLLTIGTVWLSWAIVTGATENPFAPVSVGIATAAILGAIWRAVAARRG